MLVIVQRTSAAWTTNVSNVADVRPLCGRRTPHNDRLAVITVLPSRYRKSFAVHLNVFRSIRSSMPSSPAVSTSYGVFLLLRSTLPFAGIPVHVEVGGIGGAHILTEEAELLGDIAFGVHHVKGMLGSEGRLCVIDSLQARAVAM